MRLEIGDRIYDEDWEQYGTVMNVTFYDEIPIIEVKWDDGTTSDFSPNSKTILVTIETQGE